MAKIILVAASSLDGKITRGGENDISSWTSPEDKKLFTSLVEKAKIIIMGRKTYETARSKLNLNSGARRIVLTRNPKNFSSEEVAGKLEFTNEEPEKLVSQLEKEGYSEILLAGGSEINSLFLKAGLIDEIRLTIEPLIFGVGIPLFAEEKFKTRVELINSERLNEQGSLYLTYKVLK